MTTRLIYLIKRGLALPGRRLFLAAPLWAAVFGVIMVPEDAWALQTHPAPEGLYVHQLAHIFFIFSMGILAYWLQANRLVTEKGWRHIQVSCLLFILWNLDTLTVHWIEHTATRDMLMTTGLDWSKQLVMTGDWRSWVYYFGKFDHVVLVPAIVALLSGLRQFYRAAEAGQERNRA